MEYGLGQKDGVYEKGETIFGLNPCCNGIWSRTDTQHSDIVLYPRVLILVVMEYGLGQKVYA